MYDTTKDLLDALRATPDTLEGLLRGVTQEQAQAARGGDEGWSIVEVLCHLRDAEERTLARTIAMRDEDDPFLAGYDQEAWARERAYNQADLREALAGFVGFRAQLLAVLGALSAAEWERAGRHEEQGTITISNLIVHIVAHDAIHAAQIARQLGQVQPER
jgi:hypothetical protein